MESSTWKFKDQHLLLLPQKAMFWLEQRTLILSDVHLGKVGHFRKAGIAIPKLLEQEDLAALSDLIREYKPQSIIFLGDLFHSEMNNDWSWLILWRQLFYDVHMYLVRGNHDILQDQHYLDAGFELFDRIEAGPFLFIHEPLKPTQQEEKYVLSGHIHPAIKLRGKGRQSATLCCFYFGEKQGILPSFGKFTGNYIIKPGSKDTVFGVLENKVIALNRA